MGDTTLAFLVGLAATTGFLHTLMGPDHYLPFVAMSRVGRWSARKTLIVTLACGVGHVGSSVLLGLAGVALGLAVGGLEALEGYRGDIAGWLLLGFGIAYTVWGIRRAIINKPHKHAHAHADGAEHSHKHTHADEHAHVHKDGEKSSKMTPWVLFTIFIFGPCEPLIPQLMYPAAKGSWFGVLAVAAVFGVATIGTMTLAVTAGYYGLGRLPSIERYAHAAAGFAITACGLAIKLGL